MQERSWKDGHPLRKLRQWYIKMKKLFSKYWKSSKQPRKQRKYRANAPLHIKRKMININLSKDLRKSHGKRSFPAVKGDLVKVMRGKFRKKQGKITRVYIKKLKISIENVQTTKRDGSKVDVRLNPSNLQIIEIQSENTKKRIHKKTKPAEKENSTEIKKELKKDVPKKTKST